ncbi:MAG: hypothetical protein K2G02_06010, partial [Phocaeicola sp.]|nr:hypothetical protein [Phocaeicola sp.]
TGGQMFHKHYQSTVYKLLNHDITTTQQFHINNYASIQEKKTSNLLTLYKPCNTPFSHPIHAANRSSLPAHQLHPTIRCNFSSLSLYKTGRRC